MVIKGMKIETEMKAGELKLDEYGDEELQKIITRAKEELAKRSGNNTLVLYTHGCKKSADYHLRKYKHWAKLITKVDTTKTNGYAFDGKFLNVRNEHKLKTGSIVVEVCSGELIAYQIQKTGKKQIAEGSRSEMSAFIEEVAKYM